MVGVSTRHAGEIGECATQKCLISGQGLRAVYSHFSAVGQSTFSHASKFIASRLKIDGAQTVSKILCAILDCQFAGVCVANNRWRSIIVTLAEIKNAGGIGPVAKG